MLLWDDGSGPAAYFDGFAAGSQSLGQPAVVRWDGAAFTPYAPAFQSSAVIYALASFDDGSGEALYVGGQRLQLAPNIGLMRWSGTSWTTVGNEFSICSALAVYDDGAGPQLYAGFFGALRRWDGATWQTIGEPSTPGIGVLRSMVEFDDGSGRALYVAGAFQSIRGVAGTSRIARWRNGSWSSVGGGCDGTIHDLAVADLGGGPRLYACGEFSTAGGAPAARVASWDGTQWAPLGAGQSGTIVWTVAPFDDGNGTQLYVGKQTPGTGSLVSRWDGTSWSEPGTSIQGVNSFTFGAFEDAQGARGLIVGGVISNGTGTAITYFARWSGCAFVPYCAGDGSSAPCPCGNTGASGRGCAASSGGSGALLSLSGTASVGHDTLVMHASGMESSTLAIFLQASARANGGQGVPFGDGVLCLDGSFVRLAVRAVSVGSASFGFGIAGDLPAHVRGRIAPDGGTVHVQAYYRDPTPLCTSATFNVTNAITTIWAP